MAVISSQEGEQWKKGRTYTVEWDAGAVGEQLQIALYQGSELIFATIDPKGKQAIDANAYEWSVPSDLREGDNYTLRFEQFDSVDIYRESLPFSIVSHQKSSNESTEPYRNGESFAISLIVLVVVLSAIIACFWCGGADESMYKLWVFCVLLECVDIGILW